MRVLKFIFTILILTAAVVYVSVNENVSQYIKFIVLNPSTTVLGSMEKSFTPEIKNFLAENVPGIWGTDYACKLTDPGGKSESAVAGQVIHPTPAKRYLHCPQNIKIEIGENASVHLLRNINKKYMGIELLSGSMVVESEKTLVIKMKNSFHTINSFWQGSRMRFITKGDNNYAVCLDGVMRDDVKFYSFNEKVENSEILASFNCQLQATYSQLAEQEPRTLFSEDAVHVDDLYGNREKQDPKLISVLKEAMHNSPSDFTPRINLANAAATKATSTTNNYNWATNLAGEKSCTIYEIPANGWRVQAVGVFTSNQLTGSANFTTKQPNSFAAIRCDSAAGSVSSLTFRLK